MGAECRVMGWKLIQGGIVAAFVYWNIIVGWTDNVFVPVVIGIFVARVLTGIAWRLSCWRNGIPVEKTEAFHKNLIAHKAIAAEATDNIQVSPQYSVQSAKPVDPEEVRRWVERLERHLKRAVAGMSARSGALE
jgi:hypothetical protein